MDSLLLGKFVTAKLYAKEDCRQGWVISLKPFMIQGETGQTYFCEGKPTVVSNPPGGHKQLFYRVQNKYSRGPFYPGFASKWLKPRKDHDNLLPWYDEHPELWDSYTKGVHPEIKEGDKVVSACSSLKKLRRWFIASEIKALKPYGFECYQLAGRLLAESDIQSVIILEKNFKPLQIPLHGFKSHTIAAKSRLKQVIGI